MSEKKKVTITGQLIYPLTLGMPAVIREEKVVRRTSKVQHFISYPSGEIWIETRNTCYTLKPVSLEQRACV